MNTILLVTAITALTVALVYMRVYRGARAEAPADYTAHVTEEQKLRAIEAAPSGEVLREMWRQWRERGWQDGGAMHARVLLELKSHGVDLTAEERLHLANFQDQAAVGTQKPTIRGRMR